MLRPLLFAALLGLAAGDLCRRGSPPAADFKCIECDSAGTRCTECNYASYLAENGTCISCEAVMPHCLECSDADMCTLCASWYGLKAEGENVTCARCADKLCEDCREDWQECLKCWQMGSPPASLVNGKCVTCGDSNCASCADGGTACKECNSGYGLVGGRCLKCSNSECSKCDGDEKRCSECEYGLALVDGGCVKCAQKACTNCPKSPAECEWCTYEFYLAANKTCLPHPQGCSSTEPNGTCTSCSSGYGLSGGACKRCTAANCDACNDALDKCTSCTVRGIDLVLVNGTCVPCTAVHCLFCGEGPTVCGACVDGYYLTPNGTCIKATIEGCEQPAADGTCQSCQSQRGLVDGKCVQCKAELNCYHCDGNPAVCSRCDTSSKLENGACKLSTGSSYAADPGCASVSADGKCISCYSNSMPSTPSFTMIDGVCTPCADPLCANCDTPRNCTDCQRYTGFDELSGRCRMAASVQRPEDIP
ncbi:hypothetical protein COHA_009396 [Chlorella ohadii]|uniref:Uncharacterized protein n=1 Tax=Chlorella ohadii TaxID=2649997 RepID=A0AAD5DI42_9CHLO|nr:hypothetical protein COHA_009396 [Chlorella ohadii]